MGRENSVPAKEVDFLGMEAKACRPCSTCLRPSHGSCSLDFNLAANSCWKIRRSDTNSRLTRVSEFEGKWNQAKEIFGREPSTFGPRTAGDAKKAWFKKMYHELFPPATTKQGDRDDAVIDRMFDWDYDS
jgi:hypothetical protein